MPDLKKLFGKSVKLGGEKVRFATGVSKAAKKFFGNDPKGKWLRRFFMFAGPAAAFMGVTAPFVPLPLWVPLAGGIVAGAGVAGIVYATYKHFNDKKKGKDQQQDQSQGKGKGKKQDGKKHDKTLEKDISKSQTVVNSREEVQSEHSHVASRVEDWVNSQNFDVRSEHSDVSETRGGNGDGRGNAALDDESVYTFIPRDGAESEYSYNSEKEQNFKEQIEKAAKEMAERRARSESSDVENRSDIGGKDFGDTSSDRGGFSSEKEGSVEGHGSVGSEKSEGGRESSKVKLKLADDNNPFRNNDINPVEAKVVTVAFKTEKAKVEEGKQAQKAKKIKKNSEKDIDEGGDGKAVRASVRAAIAANKSTGGLEVALQELLKTVTKIEPVNSSDSKVSDFKFENGQVNVKETPGCTTTNIKLNNGKELDILEYGNGRFTIKATGSKGENVVMHGTNSGSLKDIMIEDNTTSKSRFLSGEKINTPEASGAKQFLSEMIQKASPGLQQFTSKQVAAIINSGGTPSKTPPAVPPKPTFKPPVK